MEWDQNIIEFIIKSSNHMKSNRTNDVEKCIFHLVIELIPYGSSPSINMNMLNEIKLSGVQNPSIIPFYWLVYRDSPIG